MNKKEYEIVLPLIPKEFSYEDYVSSVLNAGGYYLERGLHKREKNDILELDIVTNKFTAKGVEKTISEIKSGNWGFPDIFKVRGWMDYLGFNKASFVVQKIENKEIYDKVSSRLGISLIITEEFDGKLNYDQIQADYATNSTTNECAFVENLRFSYALERKLISDINSTANNIKGFQVLKEYLFDLCDNTFFEASSSGRICKTFKLFTEHKHITARLDNEKDDLSYSVISVENASITNSSFDQLFYKHEEPNKLYGALYVEMLNRLLVLKHCVEDLLRPEEEQEVLKLIADLNHAVLPSNIKDAMKKLKRHAYFYLYPYFWQVFIFLFGGFIVGDKEKDEYKLLSEISGIPTDEIDNALSAFDLLFPLDDGWLKGVHNTSIKILRFMPSPFCGIGVNLRKDVYCKSRKLEGLKEIFPRGYTYSDLIRYNNLAYDYLKKSKNVVLMEKDR